MVGPMLEGQIGEHRAQESRRQSAETAVGRWAATIREFELRYLRDKQKHEIDFLIVRDGVPWLPVEVKSGELAPSASWKALGPLLPCKQGLQIVRKPVRRVHLVGEMRVLVIGAGESLSALA